MFAIALYAPERAALDRLRQQLAGAAGLAIRGSAYTPAALARLLAAGGIAAVVMTAGDAGEVALPAGVALIRLAGDDSEDAALSAFLAGADAVLPPGASSAAASAAVAAAVHGLAVVPRALLAALLAREPALPAPVGHDDSGDIMLTRRERDILAALADGASNKLIARRLGISFHTVKFHVASILAKLDAETRTEAVARAARLGLVML
jgi:DNA-binding NarL/FixJ family response regulator